MSGLAIIAGEGRLPAVLAGHLAGKGPAPRVFALHGFRPDGLEAESFRIEHLGSLLARLVAEGVRDVVFAGAARRPDIDPAQIDAATAPLVPRLTGAMRRGDDGLLREVIAVFEEAGLAVRGAAEVTPSLVAGAGALCGSRSEAEAGDAARGRAILEALGPLDLGQACVVSSGQCLGIEALPGTAALLRFVAETRRGAGGVLVKRPKPGQDLRVDMPAIGPDTVTQAQAAGLRGIALGAGGVLVIDRPAVLAAADKAGIAIWAEP